MESKSYEEIVHICYEIRGKNFSTRDRSCKERVNAFLRKFRRELEKIKIEDGDLKIWVTVVDEFVSELLDTTKILCSHQLRFTIVDGPGWAKNKNEKVRPMIHRRLRDMYMWNELKYAERLEIQVVDSCFQGSYRSGKWPEERPMVVSG
jgi:hypothetical protein